VDVAQKRFYRADSRCQKTGANAGEFECCRVELTDNEFNQIEAELAKIEIKRSG
jgi:hypothetical protein